MFSTCKADMMEKPITQKLCLSINRGSGFIGEDPYNRLDITSGLKSPMTSRNLGLIFFGPSGVSRAGSGFQLCIYHD